MQNAFNVKKYLYGKGAFLQLDALLEREKLSGCGVIYCVDHYFQSHDLLNALPVKSNDHIHFVDTTREPTTEDINHLCESLMQKYEAIDAVVGIGGGATLDTAKAFSNLWTNGGKAEDYQGWDLVKKPGVFKIGIPTLSGTGAESSKTCVMTNYKSGLKLGMNSEYTVFDQVILDPDLTKSVPRNQYFYSGMDTFVHCIESLNGNYRNAIGDAFSHQALQLCQEVFTSEDMQSEENREKMMVASYLGGCAIANSFVGLVHPLSAGLSMTFGTHHCVGNCIVMNAMQDYYPKECEDFHLYMEKQNIQLPENNFTLDDATYNKLYETSIIHEKPLSNALGDNFKEHLTTDRVKSIFKKMLTEKEQDYARV